MADIETDDRAGNAHWPDRPGDPRIKELVDPSSGEIAVRMFNAGPNTAVEAISLDISFRR